MRLNGRAGVLVALAMLLGSVHTVLAVSASDATPVDPRDLGTVLVPPAGPTYDLTSDSFYPKQPGGPLDAAEIAQESSDPAGMRSQLAAEGFTRGFRRAWFNHANGLALSEKVEAFLTDKGAHDQATPFPDSYLRAHDEAPLTAPGIPAAYGILFNEKDGTQSARVAFPKGNLFLTVTVWFAGDGAPPADRSQPSKVALDQAHRLFQGAPAETTETAPASAATSGITLGVLMIVILVMLLVALSIVAIVTRLGKPAPPVFAPAYRYSPDGRFLWDGVQWRDMSGHGFAGYQWSPDGAYWYDGVVWRPAGR